MKETYIKEFSEIHPNNPVLIEGLPGIGFVANTAALHLVRELKANGKVLVTTLLSPKAYPKHEIKELYKKRWHVEVDLRNIKTTLGMETLSRKTPQMVEKKYGFIS